MHWLMPRRSRYSTMLRDRAKELGVRVPIYEMDAATAEVDVQEDVQEAAREIVTMLGDVRGDEPVVDSLEAEELEGENEPSTGSGSKKDPRVISLSF
jgi:hypothetical protein